MVHRASLPFYRTVGDPSLTRSVNLGTAVLPQTTTIPPSSLEVEQQALKQFGYSEGE